MLACCSLTAMAAEFCREYEKAAESTKHTRSLDDLLKRNRRKTVEPAETYTDLKLKLWDVLWPLVDHLWQSLQLLQRATEDLSHPQSRRVLYNPKCVHEGSMRTDYVGDCR